MIKHVLIFILSLLPLAGFAQQGVGTWTMIPSFGSVDKMIDTPKKVYIFTSTKSLYSFDKENDEIYSYGVSNKLTEADISSVYYNKYAGFLAIAYTTASIDILYDNGKVVKLSDIQSASVSSGKEIKCISFCPGAMLVQTGFGLVLYDTERMVVKDSGIYSSAGDISASAVTENYIALHKTSDKSYYFMPRTKRLNNIDNFEKVANVSGNICERLERINENTIVGGVGTWNAYFITYDVDTQKATSQVIGMNQFVLINSFTPTQNGLLLQTTDAYMFVNEDLTTVKNDIPVQLKGSMLASWKGIEEVWVGNADGVGAYDFADDNCEMLVTPFKPNGLVSNLVGQLHLGKSGRLYVMPYGNSHGSTYKEWNYTAESPISIINPNGDIVDGTMVDGHLISAYQGAYTGQVRNEYSIIEHPVLTDIYLTGSLYDGVQMAVDGHVVNWYNNTNSTLDKISNSSLRAMALDYDSKNNLWVLNDPRASMSPDGTVGLIHYLPAAKFSDQPTERSDWYRCVFPTGNTSERDGRLLACKKSNIVMAGYYNSRGIYFLDNKGTLSPGDDVLAYISDFYDQDGKIVNIQQPLAMVEDNNGQIWVAHSKGVFSIPNPAKFNDSDFRINHIKVPRNDGTNFADYLLDSQTVTSIAVDSFNRKWLGTLDSGVYLVSPDGSQILEHFTTDNSYLPSNTVYTIAIDHANNAVYFGGRSGLVKYEAENAPSADDFSEVYAYPNPVRPDYNGWIIIKGLMDNSLVKIADATGNVVFQGNSQGGLMSWDGCDATGRRVKTGVYYVFASNSSDNSSKSAVTKILVVN